MTPDEVYRIAFRAAWDVLMLAALGVTLLSWAGVLVLHFWRRKP
jgi:hypothetical protein